VSIALNDSVARCPNCRARGAETDDSGEYECPQQQSVCAVKTFTSGGYGGQYSESNTPVRDFTTSLREVVSGGLFRLAKSNNFVGTLNDVFTSR